MRIQPHKARKAFLHGICAAVDRANDRPATRTNADAGGAKPPIRISTAARAPQPNPPSQQNGGGWLGLLWLAVKTAVCVMLAYPLLLLLFLFIGACEAEAGHNLF